ncbi:MAG: lamin tail domain-containing protein [Flavobacteriales bacterium]|nr:lamin tail domain-containing protein [Flavobacteriales bacterium]
MRQSFLLGVLILLLSVKSKAQFTDDFSDGDFISNPAWTGSSDQFIVNANGELQLNASEAGQSYLITSLGLTSLDNVEWRFSIKQSFSGSSNNYSRLYLSSGLENVAFTGNQSIGANGYFLLFGEAGSEDAIRLFRDDNAGDAPVEILAGSLGQVSSSFDISIRLLRDELGNWSLFVDPNAGEEYVFEATGFDNTYTTADFLAWVCTYTVSNADNFFLDNIYVGEEIVDVVLPELLSVEVLDENSLLLSFSEPLDASSALNPLNYAVIGLGNPNNLAFEAGSNSNVQCDFGSNFTANVQSEITVSGIADLSENIMESTTFPFTYIESNSAQAGDVVINEILADPSPALGLPEFEFVELFNASELFFDLSEWIFVNTTTEKVLPSFPFPPGEHVILCDEAAVSEFQAFGNVIGIPSFTALSNAGDSLTLRSNEGEILDIVAYDIAWYGNTTLDDGGITLERINPFGGCGGANNWSASQSFAGGTPGAQNTIFSDAPDITAPELIGSELLSSNQLLVRFSESLDFDTPVNISTSVNDLSISFVSLAEGGTALLFTFTTGVEAGVNYQLSIEGISDCTGNLSSEVFGIDFTLGFDPQLGELIINEVLPDPDEDFDSPNAEFIELYNLSDQVLELSNINLSGGVFNQQVTLNPGGYIVLCDEDDLNFFVMWSNVVGMSDFPSLTNSGRTIELFNGEGELIDAIAYDLGWYQNPAKDDGGWSIERINPNKLCSDENNWRAAANLEGATPGQQNSVFDASPDQEAPELLEVLVIDATTLELRFNEAIDPVSLDLLEAEIGLNGGDFSVLDYSITQAVLLNQEGSLHSNTLVLQFDNAFAVPLIYEIHLSGVYDCAANGLDFPEFLAARFALPEPHELGDLIVNEILSNPRDNGVDYVEIYNRSNKNISLQGWHLANDDEGSEDLITDRQVVLFAGEYLLLSTDKNAVAAEYPRSNPSVFLEMSALPPYSNGDGSVLLLDSLLAVSDRVDYSEDQHYALLNDLDGVALERLDPFRNSNDKSNWHSASKEVEYGTPGLPNSQFFVSEAAGELSLSPDVFSPDNDGFEDVLNIDFVLPEPGYTYNISIYTDRGILVRRLVLNQLAGAENTVSWDGFTDDRSKAGIGMYIVFLEAFSPEGNVIQHKAVAVLGHQLN